jgi:hypothetical protein
MKFNTYFTRLVDTYILGPTVSFEEGKTQVGLSLIAFEIGIAFDSERVYRYGCHGCAKPGYAVLDELPPGWKKVYRPDRTYFFLCADCQGKDFEVNEDYVITPENQEHAIDEIIGQLKGANEESHHLRDFAHKLLEESDNWGKDELSASIAAYSDGYEHGKASK